jgi:hypothetical protein
VRNDLLSPVRPHSENGSVKGLEVLLPGAHKTYDYNEVFSK